MGNWLHMFSLQSTDLGAHTLFYSEIQPQNCEERDLRDKPCCAVENHITERTGP